MHHFDFYKKNTKENGEISKVNHPIVTVEGLDSAKLGELLVFENGEVGEVFSINNKDHDVLVFSYHPLRVGEKVVRTKKTLSIEAGKSLLGKVIDPLGKALYGQIKAGSLTDEVEIDVLPLGIEEREKITQPLHTGVTLIDLMVPIGCGQRELIIGDRKTGKSSFLLSTIKTQVNQGVIAIYAVIAKKKTDIKKIEEFFKKEKILSKIIIVATSAHDSPSLIYLTPYSAMALAEYFRKKGQNVLLVLDDLSTHAKFYREISLLAKRFPGRDSYPGDIFYIHARLLERAGNFKTGKSSNWITCLPVVETVEGDLTGYIATNLMGMTDGHIFFDSNAYYRGRRPAVNIALSVTRVGRQTQSKIKRDINREVGAFLALYEKMQNLSHFGAELTDTVRNTLTMGEKVYSFFDQPYTIGVPEEVQLVLFSLLWLKYLQEEDSIEKSRVNLIEFYLKNQPMFEKIVKAGSFNDLLSNITDNKTKLLEICRKKTK